LIDLSNHVLLRDHVVRRLATEKELRGRVRFTLTARDRELLTAIDWHGFLTADVIDLAFYTAERSKRRASTAADDRLRWRWLGGLVEGIERPVARVIGGNSPFLEAAAEGPARRHRLERSSDLYVDYNVAVASFWANLMAVISSRPIRLRLSVPERDIRAHQVRVKDPRSQRPFPFLPDAYFEVHDATGRVQCCLLEVDLGTHPLPCMRRKLRAFALFLSEGLFADIWQRSDFEILLLASSERRSHNITNVARVVVCPERHDAYSFATVDILDPSRFPDATWRCPDGEAFGLLYSSEEGEQHGVSSTANDGSAL
jgi:hypothetical protein